MQNVWFGGTSYSKTLRFPMQLLLSGCTRQHFGDRYVMTTFYFLQNFNARIFFFFLGMTPTGRNMKLRYLWRMKKD
jgi:hypothetical protein